MHPKPQVSGSTLSIHTLIAIPSASLKACKLYPATSSMQLVFRVPSPGPAPFHTLSHSSSLSGWKPVITTTKPMRYHITRCVSAVTSRSLEEATDTLVTSTSRILNLRYRILSLDWAQGTENSATMPSSLSGPESTMSLHWCAISLTKKRGRQGLRAHLCHFLSREVT